jgi:hypothetical protein
MPLLPPERPSRMLTGLIKAARAADQRRSYMVDKPARHFAPPPAVWYHTEICVVPHTQIMWFPLFTLLALPLTVLPR